MTDHELLDLGHFDFVLTVAVFRLSGRRGAADSGRTRVPGL